MTTPQAAPKATAQDGWKKLIVCCDGTWMDSTLGLKNVEDEQNDNSPVLQQPSNVTRICRCISQKDDAGVPQITYYQSGIGTRDALDSIVGGLSGLGLSENIREAYHFLAQNYRRNSDGHGDEIYLVGFSRGAFTARSIASFINDVGLLTPKGMVYFYPIFEDWENQLKKGYKTHFPHLPFPGPRPSLFTDTKAYVDKLVELGYTTPNVYIKACAVYDTVGSLGIPRLGIFAPDRQHHSIDYAFVDTTVPPMIQHAIHALALDEMREPFAPTVWELPNPVKGQTLTQVWFAGAHGDVGGYYQDSRNADITLSWMIGQLSQYLTFDIDILKLQYFNDLEKKDTRPWSCGRIFNSFSFKYHFTGTELRHPHDYNVYDHNTGNEKVPKQPLRGTHEKVHSSIRLRCGIPGKGLDDQGTYKPQALNGWAVHGVNKTSNEQNLSFQQIQDGQKNIFWQFGSDPNKVMPEETLSRLEFDLLMTFMPALDAKFLSLSSKH